MDDFKGRTNSRKEAVLRLYTAVLMQEEPNVEDLDDYAKELVLGVNNNLDEINEIITKCLTNYSITRLNYVDASIIRLACYEMMYTDTPHKIVINEAINMTKKYSNLDDDKAKAFNNRLLDNISKYLCEK